VAVDTERGLLVPVLKNAAARPILELADELQARVARARAGKATPDDLSGGTFTITNLGALGIDAFTPIINFPECAILGIGRIKTTVVEHGGTFVPGKSVWLSLTFDHRLVDGAPAARFLQDLAKLIERPSLLWLA
jgi:pyruvate dehydrogenase E2 component (dihydrolipoamide acetyltransferase)